VFIIEIDFNARTLYFFGVNNLDRISQSLDGHSNLYNELNSWVKTYAYRNKS